MTKKEEVQKPELGMKVFHENIYTGKEIMKVFYLMRLFAGIQL